MTSRNAAIERLNWVEIASKLDIEGYVLLPGLIGADAAGALARGTENIENARRVDLTSADLGRGQLIFSGTRLPDPFETWRAAFYRRLSVVANRWSEILRVRREYPSELEEFSRRNQRAGQVRAQSHLNRLGMEDYLSLHQINVGADVFPMQVVALLSEPGTDFLGGEFVMTEQRPRMQSRPIVVPLRFGDAAIITTAERPFKGTKGYYRVNLKHAITRVRWGQRIGVELTFHNAP